MAVLHCNPDLFLSPSPHSLRAKTIPETLNFQRSANRNPSLSSASPPPPPPLEPRWIFFSGRSSRDEDFEAILVGIEGLGGNDYLYRLGKESDNMNIAVGARQGVIDDLFVGQFLGKDSDIVFDYRQKATRSFEYLEGDYYIAPVFLVTCHIVKNYIAHLLNIKVPLILGIWGGKGQGKTFQTELIFRAMGIEPVIMSAGELESEKAGEPGRLIRDRYRTASQVIQNQGKMSCLMINDIDAGLGRFGNTQMTVNNQIVVGTLMNLSDNPTRVSIGQKWRETDVTHRVPIIVTGNDFSTLYAPLIRDGRMEKFYWYPDREDIINIVNHMYVKDEISREEVIRVVDTFPNQALDFYGALRSKTYDQAIFKVVNHPWVNDMGGFEKLGEKLLDKRKEGKLPTFSPPKQTVEALLESGHSLVKEQQLINNNVKGENGIDRTGEGVALLLNQNMPRIMSKEQIDYQPIDDLSSMSSSDEDCPSSTKYPMFKQKDLERTELKLAIGLAEARKWTFISDRQKGLVEIFVGLLLRVDHRFCVQYIFYFKLDIKFDLLHNDMCKAWNRAILDVKELLIIDIMEKIRRQVMAKFQKKRQYMER
uniref:Ribulose bisphosphate carboxylase/oxygenase activase, chloroplastic n=1 Tax=Ananas comosus var. bracteatus TaxID=296719 RepID=A0A6V7P5C9_ANACO|nr:unnamed protein product [Ananas comosus var. bracteatus]